MTVLTQENDTDVAKIKNFFSGLSAMLPIINAAQQTLDLKTAGRYNLFHLYLGRRETMLSRVLKDLLDPKGLHGQGILFLKYFLEELELELPLADDVLKDASIFTEYPTYHIENKSRRIDIFIKATNLAIAIENKPWAGDQLDQISDYMEEIKKSGCKHHRLVYLSGDGHDPPRDSIPSEKWKQCEGITLPYNAPQENQSLRRWILKCINETKAEKIRFILNDFESYINKEFKPFIKEDITNGL